MEIGLPGAQQVACIVELGLMNVGWMKLGWMQLGLEKSLGIQNGRERRRGSFRPLLSTSAIATHRRSFAAGHEVFRHGSAVDIQAASLLRHQI